MALSRDFIGLTERSYSNWQDFYTQIHAARQAVEDLYKPAFYSRVGLRYVNTIKPWELGLNGRSWRDLLNASFVGILGEPNLSPAVNSMLTQANLDLDDDIQGAKVTLRFGVRSDDQRRSFFTLDSDFYLEGHIDGPDVSGILSKFNELDGNLFRWAVGDGALWNALRQPRGTVDT